MLEKLSPISLKCFNAAKQEARRLQSPDLNTRHLLLGLIHEQQAWFDGLLKPYQVGVEQIVEAIEKTLESQGPSSSAKLVVSLELKNTLRQSIALAKGVSVTPVHLFLSLLEKDDQVRKLLTDLGIDAAQMQEALQPAQEEQTSVTVSPTQN